MPDSRRFVGFCRIFLIAAGIAAVIASNQNPAFRIHLTSKGLNFISRIAKSMFFEFLKKGDNSTVELTKDNGDKLTLSNINVLRFNDFVKTNAVYVPGIGVEYRIRNLNIIFTAEYSSTVTAAKHPKIPTKRPKLITPPVGRRIPVDNTVITTTSMSLVTITMVTVDISLLISVLNSAGKMKPSLEDCRTTIAHVDVKFPPEQSSLTQQLGNDDKQLRQFFQKQVCAFANTAFVPKIEHTFSNYPLFVQLFDQFYYNYSLTENPEVSQDEVVTSYAGNVYIHGRNSDFTRVPFGAPTVLDEECQSKMMCLYMSNYSLSTLSHMMNKQNKFDFNFTKDQVDDAFAKNLRTTCSTEELCAGSLVSALPKKYPNSYLEIFMRQLKGRESVLISHDLVNMTSRGLVNGYVRQPNGKRDFLFSCNIDSYTTMYKPKFQAENYTVDTKLDANHFRLYNINASMPELDADTLTMLTSYSIDNYVSPNLKKTLGRGIRLPKLIDFQMVNGTAAFEDNVIILTSDFCETDAECQEILAKQKEIDDETVDYGDVYG